jgi:DHA1 family bicyclomycin/chloramphenicol resistance-like MFS transporter
VLPPQSRLVTATLILVIGINPATLYLFIPAMPAIQASFGVDTATVQLSLSLALAAMTPATLLCGPISDAVGRRRTLLVASVLVVIGSVIAATAPSIGMLIVGRVIQACGAAAGPVLASSIIFDIHGDERAGPALARIIVGMIVATMVAPTVGGVLTDQVGWRSTFVMTLILATLLLAATWWILPETHPAPDGEALHPGRLVRAYGRLLRHPMYLGYALMVAFSMAIVYAFMAAAPHIMVRLMGRSASDFGIRLIGVALGFLVGNLMAARWTPRVGRTRMILVGGIFSLAACVGLTIALLGGALTPWTIFAPAIVAAMACGLSLPNAEAAALGVIPVVSGAASSLTNGLVLLISAIVSQAVGWTLGNTPYPLGFSMSIAAALALASFVAGVIGSATSAKRAEPFEQDQRRHAEQDAIDPIHQAAVSREKSAEVFEAGGALERRGE